MSAPARPGSFARGPTAFALLSALSFASGIAQSGCASRDACDAGDGAQAVACRARRAHGRLEFGLSREAAIAKLGTAAGIPPWRRDLAEVPDVVHNPFDSQDVESGIGEAYEVVRFFVEIEFVSDCPFLQGEIRFVPLVFFEDRLVGWTWSYVADLLGQPVPPEQQRLRFGVFCARATPRTDAEPAP